MEIKRKELFNDTICENQEALKSPEYYQAVLEQWKTAISLSSDISNRKKSTNTFYSSLISLLLTAAFTTFELSNHAWYILTTFSVLGIIFTILWYRTIRNYAILSSIKFDIINELETLLPVNLLKYEWNVVKENKKYKKIVNSEKCLIIIFLIIFIALALLSTVMTIISLL